jgi:hypothetical protein
MIEIMTYEKFVNDQKVPKQFDLQQQSFEYTTNSSKVFNHFYQGRVTVDKLLDVGMGAMEFLKVRNVQDNRHHVPEKLHEIIRKEYCAKLGFQRVVKPFFWTLHCAQIAKVEYQKENIDLVIIEDVDNDMEEYESFA